MANNISSILNSRMRLSGLSSGLDVDSIVQQLMRVEQAKVDKVKQSRTLLEWKRDDYRSIINSIRAFKDEYFDVLKPATNMRSASAFLSYRTTYNGADTSSYFTATAGSGATSGTFSISKIKLAQTAKAASENSVTAGLVGGKVLLDGRPISAANDNNKISVTFNGTTKEITLTDGLDSVSEIVDDLQLKLNEAFGTNKINVESNGDGFNLSTEKTNVLSIGYSYNSGSSKIFGAAINAPLTLDKQSNKFTIALKGAAPETIEVQAKAYANADELLAEVQKKIDENPNLAGKVRALNQNNRIVLKAIGSNEVTAAGELTEANILDGAVINSDNRTFDVTVDGVTKTITLEEKNYTKNELLSAIQSKLNSEFGSNKVMVSMEQLDESTGKLRFESISDTETVTVGRVENGGIASLGYTNANKSNKLNLDAKLSDISGFFNTVLTAGDGDADGYDIEFTINGEEFRFKSSQTLSQIISTVNGNSKAGVKMYYDQLNDKLTVESKSTGITSKVKIDDVPGNGNLMSVLGLAGVDKTGEDASITYNDGSGEQTITRSGNDFTVNGIAFSLKKEYEEADPIEVNIKGDPNGTFELIKGFVNKYNELIDKINSELTEKRYKDYAPLTDEEKAAMQESDIKLWEEKAKSGMLRNDSILSSFVNDMREALYKEVEGISKKLYSIGITTGTWDQKGKLVINEDKLKEAITNSPDEVANLFAKSSSIAYSPDMSAADRAARDSQNGIANRLYDVIQDYIRTTRNSEGQKGILLEKAGIIGDTTEISSTISKEIQSKDSLIKTLTDKLIDKENQYYAKFTAMETALSRMNSQIAWLTQQMG